METEKMKIFVKDRELPFSFYGKYLGHNRPDGVLTKNWHYYLDEEGNIYHFRKENIVCVISKKVGEKDDKSRI